MPWKYMVCDRCHSDKERNMVMVMLKDTLWAVHFHKLYSKKGILCLKCMQEVLGRPITLDDLSPCRITDEMLVGAFLAQQTPNVERFFPKDFLDTH